MMEWGWGALLIVAAARRSDRPLALLLLVKWWSNYAAAAAGWWVGPALLDLLPFGAAGVVLAGRLGGRRAEIIGGAFVLNLLAHGWHWMLWEQGTWVGVQYRWLLLWLFTAQVVALSWPGVADCVRYIRDHRLFTPRGLVAWLAPAPELRWRGRSEGR